MHRVGGTSQGWPTRQQQNGVGSSGQAVVEFAIVLPLLMLMLLLTADFGRLFYTSIAVNNAARDAVFTAATEAADADYEPDAFAAAVRAAALREANAQTQFGEGPMTVSAPVCFRPGTSDPIDCHTAAQFAAGIGNQVEVSVSQPFEFITPFMTDVFGGDVSLSATVTGTVLNPLDATIVAAETPSPSATPEPEPTATAAPEESEEPEASTAPEKWCTVPNFYHTYFHDPDALHVWHVEAGFSGELVDHTDGKKIRTQSQPAGLSAPCDVSMVLSDK